MTQDEWNNAENYMEGYMLDLTYDIVTQKTSLKSLINSDEEVILSYDPFSIGETDEVELLQDLIDHYIEVEEYEKCANLLKLKLQVEKGLLDLSNRLYFDRKDFEIGNTAISRLIDETLNNKFNQN